MRFSLAPHPAYAPTPFMALEAELARRGGHLHLAFRVSGASALKTPPTTAPARRDGLWRTTCFEAFIRPDAGAVYYEFNMAPSGDWAAYRFDAYRRGMADAGVGAPRIDWRIDGRAGLMTALLDLEALSPSPSARLGLSAVLESMAGEKSFWALAHPADKPDFHRADGFIARLPFESGA